MKKVLWWITGVAGAAALLLIGFLAYLGLLPKAAVTETVTGPYTYAYEEFTGPYKNTGPVFDRVYKTLAAEGITTTKGIGVYFDNPMEVPADKLRSHCGSIIEEKDAAKVAALKDKVKIGTIQAQESVVVELPLKNSLSYMFGPMKAYPALGTYISEKGYKATRSFEIYDMSAKKILYVMQVTK
jgi:hypothetical protein